MRVWPFQQEILARPSQLTKNYYAYVTYEEARNLIRKCGFMTDNVENSLLDEMDSLWNKLSDYEKEKINNNGYDE